jgi:glycosyltransferase involved in cell wall biosynthesis
MEKISIVTIFNKHEEFIKLQYNSILKHIKGEYEYIVFDNASTEEQSNKIKIICDELNIKCIRINVNYNTTPSYIAGNALNESFAHLSDKIVFKIDSDMFFISEINLSELCSNYDLFYIETNYDYMWSGVFSINMNKIKGINLDFNPQVIPNTDTFGQSYLLTTNSEYTKQKMFLYCILDESNGVINGLINNDCKITLSINKIIDIENNRYENLYDNLNNKFFDVYKTMIDYKFPKPYHIDIITLNDVDIIVHFKSSNHDDIYRNLEYTNYKKIAITKFLNDN